MTALLEAQNVKKIFSSGGLFKKNETIALEDLYLYIQKNPPTITGIAGESGSGKTTLAKLLLGFIAPSEGKVMYKGKDLEKMTRNERMVFQREVQAVFQDPFESYNPFYKIDHVLTTPLVKYNLASSKTEARKMIENALEVIGLQPGETLGRYPHQLSGGHLLANQCSNNNENEKQACKFVDRCPKAMAICRQKHPPLYQTDPSRAVRCFLYKNAVELPGKDFGKVMSY